MWDRRVGLVQIFTEEEVTCVQITYRKGVQKGFIGKECTQGADIVQGKWGREGQESVTYTSVSR